MPIGKCKGRWLTFAARVYVPSGQGNRPGRIALADSTGSTIGTWNPSWGCDACRWAVVTRIIPDGATNCRVITYGDTSPETGYVHVSEAVCVAGRFPKKAASGQRGLPGPAGQMGRHYRLHVLGRRRPPARRAGPGWHDRGRLGPWPTRRYWSSSDRTATSPCPP